MEAECTSKCRSVQHGRKIVSALTKGAETDALVYLRSLCRNVVRNTDEYGRNATHLAASCGKTKVLEWLVDHGADVDAKDSESGWTALHRSLFYGQLAAAKLLVVNGASMLVQDHDGYTPLDLVRKDRLPYVEYSSSGACEAYLWGTNTNFNLGNENQQSRVAPELVEVCKTEKLNIKQVVMCKYHTVFLSSDGRVYSCGHGHGGRLGHGSEQTVLAPKQIKGLNTENCIEIAAGTDHTVFLTDNGTVWTCGLNSYHQLGHNPPPERQLSPKMIKLFQQKGIQVIGISASRFHTVAYTKDAVFSFGLNAGQLGHLKGDKTEINPRQVSALHLKDTTILSVITSEGATVALNNKGDVYVLHEFQCRKIASKQLDIVSIAASGGHLDPKCCPTVLKENSGHELKILLLTKLGKLFLWSESKPHLHRCLFTLHHPVNVVSLVLNYSSVGLVSDSGEGFVGSFCAKKQSNSKVDASGETSTPTVKKEKKSKESLAFEEKSAGKEFVTSATSPKINSFIEFLDKDECPLIKLERLPHIHRGISISSDPKGRNFAVLQAIPSSGVLETPNILNSEFNHHFAAFYNEIDVADALHDVIFRIDNQQFPAHKYILACQAEYFRNLFKEIKDVDEEIPLERILPIIFKQILSFFYSGTCEFLKVGFKLPVIPTASKQNNNDNNQTTKIQDESKMSAYAVKISRKKCGNSENLNGEKNENTNPIKLLQEAAKRFGMKAFLKQLETVRYSNGKVTSFSEIQYQLPKFGRKKFPELHDLAIESEDGGKLFCHKCVLVARSEYFNSMFGNNWIETVSNKSLYLPMTLDVLEVIIDYLYTDKTNNVENLCDVDVLCQILVVADQLLLKRLKSICEKALANMIGLKNAAELLQFSFTYQAEQLQAVCKEFICINLTAILESKNLSIVSDEAMASMTKTYRDMILSMQYRFITPYFNDPSVEEMEQVATKYANLDEVLESECEQGSSNVSASKKHNKPRRRTRSHRDSESNNSFVIDCKSDEVPTMPILPILSASNDESLPEDLIQELRIVDFHKTEDCPTSPTRPDSMIEVMKETIGIHNMESESPPWGMKKAVELDLRAIMVQQQHELKHNNVNKKLSSANKKIQKISQKQRKKLVSSGSVTDMETNSPLTSPDSSMICSPPINPWGTFSTNNAEQLKDIMDAQKAVLNSKDFTQNNSVPRKDSSPSVHDSNSNRWINKARCETANVAFADILLEEESQKPVANQQTKPLHLIQIEEEAIEQLLKLYRAECNPDERITVMRVPSQRASAPMWKARQKH